MCVRTVEGEPVETLRTVDGEDGDYRTVSGEDFGFRNISGINASGSAQVLLGTQPTYVEFATPGSGTYTSPAGCVYIEVYAVGPGGGGAGGVTTLSRRSGGGGGAGGCAFGIFAAGSYSYTVATGGAGGATTNLPGSTGSGPTIFDTMEAGSGEGGICALSTDAVGYTAASSGAITNALLTIGRASAEPPGFHSSRGGANLFNGFTGSGGYDAAAAVNGGSGQRGGGGGGGNNSAAAGGVGGNGCITIIEYY